MLDELDDVLSSVHLPENVLDYRVVLQHGQHFQIVLMLAEKLLPEGQAVDPLALHGRRHSCSRRCSQCLLTDRLLSLIALDETCGHKQPLKGLNPHEGVVIKDWQVLDFEFRLFKSTACLLRDNVIDVCLDDLVGELLLKLLQSHLSFELPLLEESKLLQDLLLVEVLFGNFDVDFFALQEESP